MKKFLHYITKNSNFENFSSKKILSSQKQLSLEQKTQPDLSQKKVFMNVNGLLFVSKKTLFPQDSIRNKNRVNLVRKRKVLKTNSSIRGAEGKEKERQKHNNFIFRKTKTLNTSYFFKLKFSPNVYRINKLHSQFSKKQQIKKYHLILCSVSGGQDSNLNFFVFLYLKQENCLKTVYCHHFWQQKNFAACLLTFRLSFIFGVPYLLIFPNSFLLTENNSRGWRKKNFCRLSSLEKTPFFGTGHTQTDTLEKNLHNILRGVSSSSLNNQTFLNYKKTSIYYFSPVILNLKDYFDEVCENNKKKFFRQLFFNHPSSKNLIFGNCLSFFPIKNLSQEVLYKKNIQVKETFQFFKTRKNRNNSLFFNARRVQTIITKIEKKGSGNFPFEQTSFVKHNISFFKKYNFGEQTNIPSFSFCFYSKYFQSKVNSIQPIQAVERATVSKLMNLYDFPVLTDFTNFSDQFSRNKIRHQVIPFLKISFHKKIDSLITTFFKTVEKDNSENQKQLANFRFLCKLVEVLIIKNLVSDFLFFLFIFENSKPNLYSSILHQIIFDYLEIEITFSQTRKIKNHLSLEKKLKKKFQN